MTKSLFTKKIRIKIQVRVRNNIKRKKNEQFFLCSIPITRTFAYRFMFCTGSFPLRPNDWVLK